MTAATVTADKRTSYLELFFDLVFVFAITQVAGALNHDHSGSGWLHAALLLWLVWWAWSQFTWAGNAIDLERRGVRVAVITVAGLVLLAAAALPEAFGDRGVGFAVPYTAVRLSGLGLYWFGLRGDEAHRAALRTYLPVASISPLLVLAGGLAATGVRPWLWGLAVVVDLVSVAAAGRGEFRVGPEHFAERHALIVIIALGESVVAIGATLAGLEPTTAVLLTAIGGFAVVGVQWGGYFEWVHPGAEARLRDEPDHRRRGNLARDLFTLGHIPIVAGSVVFAVGVEEALVHPGDLPTFAWTALAVGLGAFVAGSAFVVLRSRPGGTDR